MSSQSEKTKVHMFRAQANLLEYLLLTFFIILIIMGVVFLLTHFQIMQIQIQGQSESQDHTFSLMSSFLSSPYLVKEKSMFDDSKLTAIKSLGGQMCIDLEKIYGRNWYIKINVLGQNQSCTWSNYPNCGYWSLCYPATEPREKTSYIIPINVHRRITGTTDIASLEVGTYE